MLMRSQRRPRLSVKRLIFHASCAKTPELHVLPLLLEERQRVVLEPVRLAVEEVVVQAVDV